MKTTKRPIRLGPKGFIIEALGKKLAVPSRDSQLDRGLNGHYVVVDKKVHDTKPNDPWKGVAFYRVRHVPEECDRCLMKARELKYKEVENRLEKEIPGISKYFSQEEREKLPEKMSHAIFDRRKEDGMKILAHKDWWVKALSTMERVLEIDRVIKEKLDNKWKEVVEIDNIVDNLIKKYNGLEYFEREFEVDGIKYRDVIQFAGDIRTGVSKIYASRYVWRRGVINNPWNGRDGDDYRVSILNHPSHVEDYGWFEDSEVPEKDIPEDWIRDMSKKFEKAYKEIKPFLNKGEVLHEEYLKLKEELKKSDLAKERQKLWDMLNESCPSS